MFFCFCFFPSSVDVSDRFRFAGFLFPAAEVEQSVVKTVACEIASGLLSGSLGHVRREKPSQSAYRCLQHKKRPHLLEFELATTFCPE